MRARQSVTIVTALTKQVHVDNVPLLQRIDELIARDVSVRILFAGVPSRPFVQCLLSFPRLLERLRQRLCVRSHMKGVAVDERRLYLGSANLTGSGLGGKGRNRRNFEYGFLVDDPRLVRHFLNEVRSIFDGARCVTCEARMKVLCRQEHERYSRALQQPRVAGPNMPDGKRRAGGDA